MNKSRLSKIIGILLIILGGIGFVVSLTEIVNQQVYFQVMKSDRYQNFPLNNTNSSGLAAIAAAIIIFVGGKLIEEHK